MLQTQTGERQLPGLRMPGKIYIFILTFGSPIKVHLLIEHLRQVIERTGKSLYFSSEQVVEAAHAKFDKIWQRYKVTHLERDSHGDKLRNYVVDLIKCACTYSYYIEFPIVYRTLLVRFYFQQ